MNISELEKKLLRKFPKKTAMDWDKTGLLVGDGNVKINKVVLALDPSVSAIHIAKNNGANLIVTHHPAFLGEIENFGPGNSPVANPGAVIYEAIRANVALMNFHTALDVSSQGAEVLPKMLDIRVDKVLVPTDGASQNMSKRGFGRVCLPKAKDKNLTLERLGKRCAKVFGRDARMWGAKSKKLSKIAVTTGSVGRLGDDFSVLDAAVKQKMDCVVCGEIKYHDALALRDAGIAIIDLGHDVSELPLVSILEKSLKEAGIKKNSIIALDQSHNWFN